MMMMMMMHGDCLDVDGQNGDWERRPCPCQMFVGFL